MGTGVIPARSMAYVRRPPSQDDIFGDVGTAADYLKQGVEGYGEQLRPGLLKEIGGVLGNINQIGGLRSGAVPVALGDIASQYGSAVGAYAKQAAGQGLEYGLQARQQRFREDQARRSRKAGLLKAIGGILGAGIGFAVGGPLGAGVGGSVGGQIGGAGAPDETYAGSYG